jgi:hypothetical protein
MEVEKTKQRGALQSSPFTKYSGEKTNKYEMGGVYAYRVLVGRPEGKKPLGRTRRRWGDNIKMNLQEVGCGGIHRFYLDKDMWRELVKAVMNLRFPKKFG